MLRAAPWPSARRAAGKTARSDQYIQLKSSLPRELNMKFGIAFANSGAFSKPALMAHLATTAERCGIESMWTVEHVVVPVKHMPYPGSKDGQMPGGDNVPISDPLLPLAFVAAITKTLKLATGILILPQRHPIYTAK